MINDVKNKAIELVNFTVEEIQTKLIDETFTKLNELEQNVVNDMIRILNEIDKLVFDISCSATGLEVKIREDVSRPFSIIPNPFNSCRIKINDMFPGHNLR